VNANLINATAGYPKTGGTAVFGGKCGFGGIAPATRLGSIRQTVRWTATGLKQRGTSEHTTVSVLVPVGAPTAGLPTFGRPLTTSGRTLTQTVTPMTSDVPTRAALSAHERGT
jgi:hypothetical protein